MRDTDRFARVCAIALIALIMLGALIPGNMKDTVVGVFPSYLHIDKVGHACGFFALGIALIRSRLKGMHAAHYLAFTLAVGAFTELCQRFVPGRTALVSDVFIDLAGASLGIFIATNLSARAFPRPKV
jgi:VanZ family protein